MCQVGTQFHGHVWIRLEFSHRGNDVEFLATIRIHDKRNGLETAVLALDHWERSSDRQQLVRHRYIPTDTSLDK